MSDYRTLHFWSTRCSVHFSQVTWQPGRNFTGVVAPSSLLGALLGYVVTSAVLPLRGLAETLPEARQLVKAVPGSLGPLENGGGLFGGGGEAGILRGKLGGVDGKSLKVRKIWGR